MKKITEENLKEIVFGQYIRVNSKNNSEIKKSIAEQEEKIDKYCKECNIDKIKRYIDIGESSFRKSFEKMLDDIKSGRINAIIVTDVAKLSRNYFEIIDLLKQDFMKNVNIITLDNSLESIDNIHEILKDKKTYVDFDLEI